MVASRRNSGAYRLEIGHSVLRKTSAIPLVVAGACSADAKPPTVTSRITAETVCDVERANGAAVARKSTIALEQPIRMVACEPLLDLTLARCRCVEPGVEGSIADQAKADDLGELFLTAIRQHVP